MRRIPALAALVVALVPSAYLAWESRDMPHLGYFHDDSLYFVAAKSLAEGQGYRIASLPEAPYQTKYPPLYPALLAVVWRAAPAFPGNLRLAAVLAWVMVPLYVAGVRVALKDLGFPDGPAWWLCALVAVNPFLGLFGISLLSELPFSILLIAALALTERAREGPGRAAAAAGAVAGLACLTRSAGLVLLVSGPLLYLLNRRFRQAVWYAVAAVPLPAAWAVWCSVHRAQHPDVARLYYTDYLGFYLRDAVSLPLIVWKNFDSLVNSIGGMLIFQLGETFAAKSLARLIAAAALVGAVRIAVRRGWTGYTLFGIGYVGLVLAWNYVPDQRFLLPVYPLLVAGFYEESARVLRALARSWRTEGVADRVAAAAVAVVLSGVAMFAVWRNVTAYTTVLPGFVSQHRAMLERYRPAYTWIGANVDRGARILAYYDPVLYLYTGRRAQRLVVQPGMFYEDRPGDLAPLYTALPDLARKGKWTHVMVTDTDLTGELSPEALRAAQRAIRADAGLQVLYEATGVSLYRVRDSLTQR